MPLVPARDEDEHWSEERISSDFDTDFMRVWRWSAADNCWLELSSDLKDWYRFKLGGKPLPGVPAGSAHFVGLVLTQEARTNETPVWYA